MARYGERMRLMIAGYEAPGEAGYVDRLKSISNRVEYLGEVPSRTGLLQAAARAHIGLALMPPGSSDINMRHMTGASNKAFDYMAAGLGLLVSDLEDWNEMFARTGFARACNPADADSIAAAFDWFLANPTQRRGMGERGRTQIETAWNYDTQFKPLLGELCAPPKNQVAALQRRVRRADVSL
jgi:glycosyltransferase involved in cell wall biosynthesis